MSGGFSAAQRGVSLKARGRRVPFASWRRRGPGRSACWPALPEPELVRQHSPLMSPLVWDVAHVANYEEQWLLRALGGTALTDPAFDAIYDAFRHPRRTRSQLPLLSPAEAFAYAARVREAVRAHLDTVPEDSPEPLLRDGFVFGMVAQHEQQHAETLAATLQLMTAFEYRPAARERPRPGAVPQHEVFIPGGPVRLGSDEAWAYDNERPVHTVDVAPFFLDAHPVTNGDYLVFVESGGYEDAALVAPEGLGVIQAEKLAPSALLAAAGPARVAAPALRLGGAAAEGRARAARVLVRGGRVRALGRQAPAHGGRVGEGRGGAATARRARTPGATRRPRQPHANLGGDTWGPAPVGAYPEGRSVDGVWGLLGDVWEWTASDFGGYAGFHAFPYREYSEVFFGRTTRCCEAARGRARPVAVRNSFRNWDYPIRRQIFAGFRCATGREVRRSARREQQWAGSTRQQSVDGGRARAAGRRTARAPRGGSLRACAGAPRSCRPSGSMTSAAASSSTTLPGCPSTTRRGASGRSSRRARRTIARLSGADTLIELGSGTSEKTRLLLDALQEAGRLRRFVPFDVSEAFLRSAAEQLAREYPAHRVHAVVGDFERHLGRLPRGGRRLVAFLGGTIGNFKPAQRARFLRELADGAGAGRRAAAGHGPASRTATGSSPPTTTARA